MVVRLGRLPRLKVQTTRRFRLGLCILGTGVVLLNWAYLISAEI